MKNFKYLILLSFTILMSCDKDTENPDPEVPVEIEISNEVAVKWAKLSLEFIYYQPGKTPTTVSRALGYLGLTMYETAVNGSIKYKSVASQLNGLGELPKPTPNLEYDWETAVNAGQAYMLKNLWQHSNKVYYDRVDSLEKAILNSRTLIIKDASKIGRSVNLGREIAQSIYTWSNFDNGHLGYLTVFDPTFTYPAGPQYWTPPINGQSPSKLPMMPHWGSNRTFVKANSDLPVPAIIPFSKETNSANFKEFQEVYEIQNKLTQEQKEIANWWGDDPSETTSPPGHSYNIAIILAEKQKTNLFKSSAVFAKVGMATADAFVNCWRYKFTYNSVRPAQFIKQFIDGRFVQFWPEPPFPAFPSGHSTQASAAAKALISEFGDNVAFDDITHVNRPKDVLRNVEYKKRSFTKISQTATECGISRLYGGIHTSQDNIKGLDEGAKIGSNISNLNWSK
jgi:hypothetical protein